MNTLMSIFNRANSWLIIGLIGVGLALTLGGTPALPTGVQGDEGVAVAGLSDEQGEATDQTAVEVIVQGRDVAAIVALVQEKGGIVTHKLGIINAVGAQLTPAQLAALKAEDEVRVYENRRLRVAHGGGGGRHGYGQDTIYPTLVGAKQLHEQGVDGSGVTIAVLDTGHWSVDGLNRGIDGQWRILAQYNAILDQMDESGATTDDNGHGTHVASVALSSLYTEDRHDWKYNGIAPNANLVSVKAFDADGAGSYMDVIRGIGWVVANKGAYDIRVLNLSFSATPQSYYWDDPLNQAVMQAWQAGIVVVASAGNTGPGAMTIGVPGNTPYVITAGAFSDNYTPEDGIDDVLTSFSATGPTIEGFIKPEVVAPGGHMLGLMPTSSQTVQRHKQYRNGATYFTMSGTSQSAAVVSGIAALVLQADPNLTPDEVKCRLMASARPAVNGDGNLAYSVFQQGAGQVNAYDAVYSTAGGCANRGLDIASDLAGVEHYRGRANLDPETGEYRIMDGDGYIWSDGYTWSDSYTWSDGYTWSDSYTWSDGYAWSDAFTWSDSYTWSDAFTWSDGYIWSDSYTWSDAFTWSDGVAWSAATSSINVWVSQE